MTEQPKATIDAVTLKRQADCPHTVERFIKGASDSTYNCPHCGESRASWEARTTKS